MYQKGLYEKVLKEKSLNRVPLNCQFDLTYHCNLNCVHCCVVKEDREELRTSQIKKILEQLAAAGTLNLHFSGGEILSRPDFFEIADYARKLHFVLTISTNATLINEEIADKLAEFNVSKINITVFSTDPKKHDSITQVSGSLQKTIEAIKILKKRDINVHISHIIMKQNISDYDDVYELAKELEAEFEPDHRISAKFDGDLSPLEYQIGDEDLYNVMDRLIVNEEIGERVISSEYDDTICNAALSGLYISPYGDVFPCTMLRIFCGNLKEKSFEQIWYRSEKMINISSLRISNLPVCSECEHLSYCHFCPGFSYTEDNDLMAPSSRACKEAKIISDIKNGL